MMRLPPQPPPVGITEEDIIRAGLKLAGSKGASDSDFLISSNWMIRIFKQKTW
jgi:hypothetical protein